MNKYLLLRDNKQSGPYTVPEIITKGIKPYDLVWLEGKSAAWRYPSEIEELKAYAPAVEEQPFDRFYKKPAAEAEIKPEPEKKSRFEPVIAEESAKKRAGFPSKKVYINFPGGPKKIPVYQEPEKEQPAMAPIYNEPAATQPVYSTGSDRKLLYASMAVCLVLIGIVSAMIINYGNQKNNIRTLNDMVQQMEKRQNEVNQAAKTALASHIIPVPIVNDQPAVPVAVEPMPPANKIIIKKPETRLSVAPTDMTYQNKTVIKQQETPSDGQIKITATPAKENLFNLVTVTPNKFRTGLLGGISGLQFELTNNSSRELQRVALEIRYLSPEKKIVKTQTVYFQKIAPGGQTMLDIPKSSRGVTIDYSITDIKS